MRKIHTEIEIEGDLKLRAGGKLTERDTSVDAD
jgi:hypothetical protein